MEYGRHLEIMANGVLDSRERTRLFLEDRGRNVGTAEEDDAVRGPEDPLVLRSAGVRPEEGVLGDVRRNGVEMEPIDAFFPDVGAGGGVIRRFPGMMHADHDEPRDVQGPRPPQGLDVPDRPHGGIEDGESHAFVFHGRGVEEAVRGLGAEERRYGEDPESEACGLMEPGQFHRSLLVAIVGRKSLPTPGLYPPRDGFDKCYNDGPDRIRGGGRS